MTSRSSAAAAASSALARATAFVQAWEDRADAASASAVDRALSTESTREPSTVSSGPPLERREARREDRLRSGFDECGEGLIGGGGRGGPGDRGRRVRPRGEILA
ncbi:MAG: hypothetical protein ACJLS2_01280 [Microcella pacifica]